MVNIGKDSVSTNMQLIVNTFTDPHRSSVRNLDLTSVVIGASCSATQTPHKAIQLPTAWQALATGITVKLGVVACQLFALHSWSCTIHSAELTHAPQFRAADVHMQPTPQASRCTSRHAHAQQHRGPSLTRPLAPAHSPAPARSATQPRPT